MAWKLGIAAPILAGLLGCATARPTSAPAPVQAATAASPGATLESLAGDYALLMIDGHKLPFPPASGGDAARSASWPVLSGTLSLRTNGTFHVETTYDTQSAGTGKNSYQLTGTCFGSGGSFQMVWDGGGQSGLTARGDTLVLNNEGRAFSYVRR